MAGLAVQHHSHKQLFRLGSLSLWLLGVVPAIWLDLDRRRAVWLGALSLWPLGLLQQLLGLVSAQLLLSPSQLVAAGAGCLYLN